MFQSKPQIRNLFREGFVFLCILEKSFFDHLGILYLCLGTHHFGFLALFPSLKLRLKPTLNVHRSFRNLFNRRTINIRSMVPNNPVRRNLGKACLVVLKRFFGDKECIIGLFLARVNFLLNKFKLDIKCLGIHFALCFFFNHLMHDVFAIPKHCLFGHKQIVLCPFQFAKRHKFALNSLHFLKVLHHE